MVITTILSIVNAAIAGLPDPIRKIRELWGCLEEHNGDGGPYSHHGTSIFDNNTAAGWVTAAMKLGNPTLLCVVYRGQQADGRDGAQMPLRGGRSYLPLDDILRPPAEHMIEDIGKELDDNGATQRQNPRSFLTIKTGFQMFAWKLQKRIIRQQRYLEVIRNRTLGLFAEYEQSVVADEDEAWLCMHDHIVNLPAACSLANRKHTSCRPAAK